MRWLVLVAALWGAANCLHAQDVDGPLSDAEVESLREVAPVPMERMKVFEKALDTREKEIEDLLAKPRRPGFARDMHDFLDQFGKIADEFNDNLDEYDKHHRDVRKELPRLLKAIDRWGTALRSPPQDDGYNIVKKIALDHLADMKEIATQTQADEEAYFKAHPEAAKAEKARLEPRQ